MNKSGARRLVAVEFNGIVEVHLPPIGAGAYATLCGMDGDDEWEGQKPTVLPHGSKVTCPHCINIWRVARAYEPKNIDSKHLEMCDE